MRRDLLFGIASSLWSALLSIAVVPLYIALIGVASYGLMGVYASLSAVATLLDLGFTATVGRYSALRSSGGIASRDYKNLVYTMQAIYLAIALLLMAIVIVAAPLIAAQWLHADSLTTADIQSAVMLMGAALCVQWPFSFYASWLIGSGKQAGVAVFGAAMSTIRAAGALALLTFVSATIETFLIWQIVISLFSTLALAMSAWRQVAEPHAAFFGLKYLKASRRFAGGISIVSVIAVVLVQVDKIVLSKILTLEAFGYYTLAAAASSALYLLVQPMYNVVAPRFVQLVAVQNNEGVAALYHAASQTMAILVIPCAAVLFVAPERAMFVWTGDAEAAIRSSSILRLMIGGSVLYALAYVPWALQIAHGWTSLAAKVNVAALLIAVPLTVTLALKFGPIGAATSWMLTNLAKIAVGQYAMHRRVLRGELARWVMYGAIVPGGISVLTVAVATRVSTPETISRLGWAVVLGVAATAATISTALALPAVRSAAVRFILSKRMGCT